MSQGREFFQWLNSLFRKIELEQQEVVTEPEERTKHYPGGTDHQ